MISDRALESAVEQGIVSADQVGRLRELQAAMLPAREAADVAPTVDDESLRFVTGFADIFVTIGLVLFLGALAFIMDARTGSTPMYAGMAACAWLLAEFFTFKRRMALPSILLLVVFVGAVFVLAAQVAASLAPTLGRAMPFGDLFGPASGVLPIGVGALVAVALAGLHYAHFRVPVTVAAGAGALCILVVAAVVGFVPGVSDAAVNAAVFGCGLAVFALAMRFDMSDPERLTRRTDIAFWLHLLAAPLIVHPLMRGFLHGFDAKLTPGSALGILWIFLLLGLLAVIVDRRALLVSGLVYAGIATGTVIRSTGMTDGGILVPLVVFALGAFILLISAGWQVLRRALLRRLPRQLAARLPHPVLASPT